MCFYDDDASFFIEVPIEFLHIVYWRGIWVSAFPHGIGFLRMVKLIGFEIVANVLDSISVSKPSKAPPCEE